jgi:hypothetical protein
VSSDIGLIVWAHKIKSVLGLWTTVDCNSLILYYLDIKNLF